jgi:hypothetical protein
MGEGAGHRLKVHGQRWEGRSARKERVTGEGRVCSGASISGEEMCLRDGITVSAGWVLEVGDAVQC